METPSSTRRVTRSQTSAASANNTNLLLSKKFDESEKTMSKAKQRSPKKQQQDRSALIDITNDSPIVGLAMGNLKTPSSAMSKKRMSGQGLFSRTPGSGEALLRGQVKTLLQKVEEEAELSKITLENRPRFNFLQGLVTSPNYLVAPTPANTPQVLTDGDDGLPSFTQSPVLIPQMFDEKKEEGTESENLITRSLLLDFSEKSEKSHSSECSSVMTYQGALYGETESSQDDESSSVWSIQVNASSTIDEDAEDYFDDEHVDKDYYSEEEVEHNFGEIDELCEGISKISVKEGPKFEGKHIRFIYNSDDEIQGVEEDMFVDECETPAAEDEDGDDDTSASIGVVRFMLGDECEHDSPASSSVVRLKGLPIPKGKHLRFPEDN